MALNTPRPDAARSSQAAARILAGFDGYNDDFRRITRRARGRFERREWSRLQDDINERYDLYEAWVQRTRAELSALLGSALEDRRRWPGIRQGFEAAIRGHADVEFIKTYFNSVTRRVFATVGADEAIEFVARDLDPTVRVEGCADLRRIEAPDGLAAAVDALLAEQAFDIPYADRPASAAFVAESVLAALGGRSGDGPVIEVLRPVFYQSTRAYLVGRVVDGDAVTPMVVALANTPGGIIADRVLTGGDELSVLFGFTRSYFMADLDAVTETVVWLQNILPRKPLAEMFTVLGRAKQGKTETYRALLKHLDESDDVFCHAPGARGMVMMTFTLPTHEVVFKVIRDRFDYPKSVRREDVIDRYRLVFRHDRAGRLIDAQEFRRLELSRRRFTPELLEELLEDGARTVRLEGDNVIIRHLYTERRLQPLNLYLQEADPEAARRVVLDYGRAIRDLARTNIFPGDLLLKNFGVTRRERVIFYDYDELCLLTDCHFRTMPEPRHEEEALSAETWFPVGPNDVFPEQFRNFIWLPEDLMGLFEAHHGDLFTVDFWRETQARIRAGEMLEILPYGDA